MDPLFDREKLDVVLDPGFERLAIGFKRFLFNVLLFLGSCRRNMSPKRSRDQPEKRRADSGRS
jgi:hypothetical protein